MPRVRTLTPGASPTHFFGSEVRRAREAAGMSQAELGALVPCDKSVVSRIEAGLVQADEAFARACDVAFPHLDGFFTRFWKDCQTWSAAFPAAFREFAAYEAEALTIWTFQHSLVPGLLQTEGYARAVLERHPNVTSEQVAERVAARLARQSVLERTDPPLLWVLLDENVLHRQAGGVMIMQDQMTHLAAMARRPNITVQVIPREGAHVGLQGGFDMAQTPDALVAHLEHIAEGMTTDSPAIVAEASIRFDSLRADAYRRSESLILIEEMAEKWKRKP
jgi:transcriptional regulator with XRE-family HTH domain